MAEQLLELQAADPVEWCEANIQLDYGAFDRDNHPLMTEPLRAGANMRGGVVGLLGSVQHIKTLCAQLLQLYTAQVAPGRQAHYDLTLQTLKEFSDDKWTPILNNTPAVKRLIPDQRHAQTTYYTQFPYGFIRLLSAGILAHRNSKTIEFVTCDESWAYDPGWLGQIKDRLTSYPWSWRMFLPSSGQTANSDLDELVEGVHAKSVACTVRLLRRVDSLRMVARTQKRRTRCRRHEVCQRRGGFPR